MSMRLSIVGLILITALALGMIAFQVSRPPPAIVQATPAAAPPPLMISYLVTSRALPAGTLARDEDFVVKMGLPGSLPDNALTDSPETRASLRGALVRRYLDPGSDVTAEDVLRVRDRGFLAAVLEPGTRAASIGVDEVSGVSGLIWPGDRVDVILTQSMDHATSVGMRVVSEAVLRDVKVLAVDQDIARSAQDQGASTSAGHIARTVTLQVSPEDSDRLAVARQLGHLSLAVRAINDGSVEAVERPSPPSTARTCPLF